MNTFSITSLDQGKIYRNPLQHAGDGTREPAEPRWHWKPLGIKLISLALVVAASIVASHPSAFADEASVKRGQYLVGVAGCGDCHTPGYFLGKPDMTKPLSGSEVGFEIPGLGAFYGPNLTPDKETGLGNWSEAEIIAGFTAGKRPDGRELAPVMPWRNYAGLTAEDAQAIAAYLKSLPPTDNKVPGPFGPTEKPTSFVMRLIPPGG